MLKVVTLKHDYVFHGEEEGIVMNELRNAYSGNFNWTTPIVLGDGIEITFNLNHIISIEQKNKINT